MSRILNILESIKNLTALLGLFSLFLAGVVRFFLPELTISALGLIILGLILLSGCVLGAHAEIKTFFFSKRGRYTLNTAAMILIFIMIMVLANYLGVIKHRRFDVTASSRFTLAPQTINVVKNLETPVNVLGFFPPDAQSQAAKRAVQNFLEEYRFHNKKFSYRFIDPEARPALAKKYNVKRNQTIIFESDGRKREVTTVTEASFTGALLEVSGIKAKKVYFLTGHGERDMYNYGLAVKGLVRDLYQVETLNLTAENRVPEDCAVLVVAGPRNALPPAEAEALENYLKRSGKVFFLLDPHPPVEILKITSEWGLTLMPGRVMDKGSYAVPDMASPAVFRGNYPPVTITTELDTTYFPEAAPIILTDELKRVLATQPASQEKNQKPPWPLTAIQHPNLAILPAVLTTDNSWVEEKAIQPEGSPARGPAGPFALGAMLVASQTLVDNEQSAGSREKLTRLVIIGDSDFASDDHFQNGGNGDLFLNAVNWLAEEENLISIRPKQYSFRRLLPDKTTERFIRYSSVGLLPLLTLILGGLIWWKKR